MHTHIRTQKRVCPICGSAKAMLCFLRKDLAYESSNQDYSVVKCQECSLGYIQNIPLIEEFDKIYPEAFYQSNRQNYALSEQRNMHKLTMVTSNYAQSSKDMRLLDIGCAGGEFVNYARAQGIEAYGYDWTTSLSSKDYLFYSNNIWEHFPQKNSFDCVTMWAVLEHVLDIQNCVKHISHVLKPNGICILLVTNFNSIPGHYMQQDDIPRHINLFTKKSLTRLLNSYNLNAYKWDFSNDIFSGSHRGLSVFLLKQLFGEKKSDIVAQHRAPGRREEFCTMLNGKPSKLIKSLCKFDNIITPYINSLASFLHLGMSMTVIATKHK